MRAMHQVQQERMQAHSNPQAMRSMHQGNIDQAPNPPHRMGMMSGGEGMMAHHDAMMMGMNGLLEAQRQMDKRLDLIQKIVEQLMVK